ncbi:MAG: hypothetical protein NT142_16070 [Planctomycetota bacterium]|nr:hypothetical protein [Planctomycetota bacterium]
MKTKKTKHRGKPDPAILADIVERIVRAATPEGQRFRFVGHQGRQVQPPSSHDRNLPPFVGRDRRRCRGRDS